MKYSCADPVYDTVDSAEVDRLNESKAELLAALQNQLGAQNKIFAHLNDYAEQKHLANWQCISLEGLIAQVYGDLAAHNAELREVVSKYS